MSALIRRQLHGAAARVSRSLASRPTCIIPTAACGRGIATASTSVNDSRKPPSAIPPHPLSSVQNTAPALPEPQPLQQKLASRREAVRNAKPFSEFLTDNFNRQHTYLRISITERCNLRCVYCMPEEGVPLTPDSKLLSTPEILHIANLFVSQGVTKIRLTGGEPTIRKDIVELVAELGKLKSKGLRELAITSNGIILARKLEKMVQSGLTAVNLSLDTLEPWKFEVMTRRKGLESVLKTIDKALELGVQPLKVNCVVMRGVNDYEIPKFVEMTREKPVEVRFIEYMPFDGNKWNENKMVPFSSMLSQIQSLHPTIAKVADHKNETSKTYQIPGFSGKIGFITSMTHNFCGTCNRLRVTSDGNLKVCLFGNEEVSLRDMMRTSEARREIVKDGGVGLMQDVRERERVEMERQMLEVIGVAVKGKREKHAGMGDLEHMKNRPMILIDNGNLVFHPNTSLGGNAHRTPQIPLHLFSHPHSSPIHTRLYYSTDTKAPTSTTPFSLPKLTPRTTITSASPPVEDPDEPHHPHHPTPTPTPTADENPQQHLPHLTPTGQAHMVPITYKPVTPRSATASCTIRFSNPDIYDLVHTSHLKKGDALSVARVAGIAAAKLTPQLVPLCHNILIESVHVNLTLLPPSSTSDSEPGEGDGVALSDGFGGAYGGVYITATVTCSGKTGVEMEALVAATVAGLNVYDMCKGVDRGLVMERVRVVEKRGGRSGGWGVGPGGKLVNVGEGEGEGESFSKK